MACDFQQCGILTSVDSDEPVQPPFKNRNSKLCSVSSLFKATSKGSDQTAHMRRLIWGITGRTYHIVGNLMLRLNCKVVHKQLSDISSLNLWFANISRF